MRTIGLAALWIAFWTGADEPGLPESLVSKLASSRSWDREQAAAALLKLGEAAVPALEQARHSTDLELRARSAALLDQIDAAVLLGPTMVPLDFDNAPLADVIAALRSRTGMDLALDPSTAQRKPQPGITLRADEPVPFWDAVARLCEAAGLQVLADAPQWQFQNQQMMFGGNRPNAQLPSAWQLVLVGTAGRGQVPASYAGSMRVVLTDLRLHRDLVLARPGHAGARPPSSVKFEAQIQVLPEPRLAVARLADARCLEAIDDLGQSLVPAAQSESAQNTTIVHHGVMAASGGPQVVPLRCPDQRGKTIRLLRGTVHAVVVGRRPAPLLVASLANDRGKPVHHGNASLTIHDVKPSPQGQGTAVELSLFAFHGRAGWGLRSYGPAGRGERFGLGPPVTSVPQLDFFDGEGRLCYSYAMSSHQLGDGTRRVLMVPSPNGAGPPVEVRYHDLMWAEREVPFVFENLPMP